jgi:hypothetical protein
MTSSSSQPVIAVTRRLLAVLFVLLGLATGGAGLRAAAPAPAFRPPSVPLVACDPYFSIWSSADRLTDTGTTHWTGKPHRLTGLVRVDGRAYRVLGNQPADLPALPLTGIKVLPTRTIATFAGAGIELTLTFTTPALPDDLDLLSRPVTYLTWDVRSADGRAHEITALFTAAGELAVNLPAEHVAWTAPTTLDSLQVARLGAAAQAILDRKGDDLRIDWGHLYLAAPAAHARVAPARATALAAFAAGTAPAAVPAGYGAAEAVALAAQLDFGRVAATPVSRWLMLAYDDIFSIQYLGANLRPYWRRTGWEAADLLRASAREYESLRQRCAAFDDELLADLTRAGGRPYAEIGALAYRQCFAAGKFAADAHGQPLQFSKENHSNGCIATSDVFYPMAPQFLLFGPSLAKSFLVPFMNYAASPRWRFPFAPHDLGTYPKANGQVYGDGEYGENNQMPVEESGNLLLLFAAVAQLEGHAGFAGRYWPQLSQWAAYLREKGFDPENQLCTDDFAGHLAHNVNLSAKAICALGAYGRLCALRGDRAAAEDYTRLAREFAQRWIREAADGDHTRLAFDKPGTWSQKYNLIWDRILGLDLFPAEVLRRELDHYRRIQLPYGLPLDNRQTYTKLDWILWTATLTQDRADFDALVAPVHRFLQETPDRAPMTDWYFADSAKKRGFTARPVVGGVFARLLHDRATWTKWAGRDRTRASDWAAAPAPERVRIVVPTAAAGRASWRHRESAPDGDWTAPSFKDDSWPQAPGGFGVRMGPGVQGGPPAVLVGTPWNAPDLWLRHTFEAGEVNAADLRLRVTHSGPCEIYLNGRLALRRPGGERGYDDHELYEEARRALRPGTNVLAVKAAAGGARKRALIDVGLIAVSK